MKNKDTLCSLAASTTNTNNNNQNTSYSFHLAEQEKKEKTKTKIPQKPKSLNEPFIKRAISITNIDIDILQKKSWKLTVNVIPRTEIRFIAIIDRHLFERKLQAAAGAQQGQQRQGQGQVGAQHGGGPPPSVSSEVPLRLWMDFMPPDIKGAGRRRADVTALC